MFVSDGDSVHQMSPSQVSVEEDGSTDSFLANEDINNAYNLARDKNLITRALETVAKVSILWCMLKYFRYSYVWSMKNHKT
jgi:hypothetical protein